MSKNKYKIWDKVHKEMHDWETVKSEFVMSDLEDDNLVFLQYTGLKDKNGKEIFEGDIVNSIVDVMESVDQVIYKGAGFYIKSINDGDLDDEQLSEATNIEVIGNIYENSHLLEQHHD